MPEQPKKILWTGSNPTKWLATENAAHVLNHGLQADGTTTAGLLADAARILRTRPFEPYVHVDPEPVDSSEDTLYTVPASSVARIWVEFVNNSGAAASITAYRYESGGTAGTGNMILQAVPVTPNGVGIRLGPYHLEASGVLSAFSSVADAITAHVTVELYGTGDAVAL